MIVIHNLKKTQKIDETQLHNNDHDPNDPNDLHERTNLVRGQVQVLVLFDDVPDVVRAHAEGRPRHHPPPVPRDAARSDGLLEPLPEGPHLDHAPTHTRTSAYIHVRACTGMYVHVRVYVYVCMYVCRYVCMYAGMYVCVYVCVCVCVYVYVYVCVQGSIGTEEIWKGTSSPPFGTCFLNWACSKS